MAAGLIKERKIGEGAYGIVYQASKNSGRASSEDSREYVAVKRNLAELTASGISCSRELDSLARLKGHPFIVDLKSVSFGDPFSRMNPMTPINVGSKGMKDDNLHLIMELIPTSGADFFPNKAVCTPVITKILTAQLMIALRWMQQRATLVHRDIKPANLLISHQPGEGPRLRVCDFGMSAIMCKGEPSTPGVSTSWYRAPEICCECRQYDEKVDMWSAGCVLFEMVAERALLFGTRDDSVDAFNAILGVMPTTPTHEELNALFSRGKQLPIRPSASPIRRYSFYERMQVTSRYLEEWQSTPGRMEDFLEIVGGLLQLDPDKRWSVDRVLASPFFDWLREYITGVEKMYPPRHPGLDSIKIIDCVERRWMIDLAYHLYNNRESIPWYTHRILFHSIDLFDRYLEWSWNTSGPGKMVTLREIESSQLGRLHSQNEVYLRFYTCLYVFHKYFTTMSFPVDWKTFVPANFHPSPQMIMAEQFEILILKHVCQYQLYRETLFEIPDHYHRAVTPELIHQLLLGYGQITQWNEGSVRALYRRLMKLGNNPEISG